MTANRARFWICAYLVLCMCREVQHRSVHLIFNAGSVRTVIYVVLANDNLTYCWAVNVFQRKVLAALALSRWLFLCMRWLEFGRSGSRSTTGKRHHAGEVRAREKHTSVKWFHTQHLDVGVCGIQYGIMTCLHALLGFLWPSLRQSWSCQSRTYSELPSRSTIKNNASKCTWLVFYGRSFCHVSRDAWSNGEWISVELSICGGHDIFGSQLIVKCWPHNVCLNKMLQER